MITINNTQYRNLEEQVLKNKQDIANHYNIDRVLADFGIRVIGQLDNASMLPNTATFSGEYGDAYAVGLEPPYSFYVWTREDYESGHPYDYWFDIGQLAIVGPAGPQGPVGEQGPQGIRGSQWFSGTGIPTTTSGYNVGDYYINVGTGNIWHLHQQGESRVWLLEGNIRGPQGEVGPRGEIGLTGEAGPIGQRGPAGPAGMTVQILGTITSIDQLPNPTTVDRNGAYLNTTTKDLYVVSGTASNLQWLNAGPLNAGTMVTENGSFVTTFDADTKLSTYPSSPSSYNIYIPTSYKGNNSWSAGARPLDAVGAGKVCLTSDGGNLQVKDPTKPTHAVSLQYAESHYMHQPDYRRVRGQAILPPASYVYTGPFVYPNYMNDENVYNVTEDYSSSDFRLVVDNVQYESGDPDFTNFWELIDQDSLNKAKPGMYGIFEGEPTSIECVEPFYTAETGAMLRITAVMGGYNILTFLWPTDVAEEALTQPSIYVQ